MKLRSIVFLVAGILLAGTCWADNIVFTDLADAVSLSLNGIAITGDGGWISNFVSGISFISFDIETECHFCSSLGNTYYSDLLNPVDDW